MNTLLESLNIASTLQDLSALVLYFLLGCSLAGQHQQQVPSCRNTLHFASSRIISNLPYRPHAVVLRLGMDAAACHRFRDMVSSWEPWLEGYAMAYHGYRMAIWRHDLSTDRRLRLSGPLNLGDLKRLEVHHSHVFGRDMFSNISRDMLNDFKCVVVDTCDRTVLSSVIRCAISQRVPQKGRPWII